MKKFFLSLAVVAFTAFSAFAQEGKAVTGGPEITVDKEVHDYGTIKQGANGTCEFQISNTGSEPLMAPTRLRRSVPISHALVSRRLWPCRALLQ
jgi:hypothetical protein